MVGIAELEGVARVARAASSACPPEERAAAVLEELRGLVPYASAELSSWDPIAGRHRLLANAGYAEPLIEIFHGAEWRREMATLPGHEVGLPIRQRDVEPGHVALRTCDAVLRPLGYDEGITMRLIAEDGRYTGMMNLSTTSRDHPADGATLAIGLLAHALANVVDATQSARHLASMVEPGADAVGLTEEGAVTALPGVSSCPILHDPELAAAAVAVSGQQVAAFVWPSADRHGWHRVRVVPLGERRGWRAVITASAPGELFQLTPRELEVLTLLAAGRSNPEIGSALYISARTAATYVERILEKLAAPSRAAAAARAVEEGLLLPRWRSR